MSNSNFNLKFEFDIYCAFFYKGSMNENAEYKPRRRSAPKRAARRDGVSTRSIVLEAAGRVFAERGFAEATSKEICERAGANSAAVNYYFGGKESLYEEVLVEAHRQMVSPEELDDIIDSASSPEEKLCFFLQRMLQNAASSPDLWGVRIYMRELAAPSPFISKAMLNTVFPKTEKVRSIIHEITGLPMDSDQIQRATAFVVTPCLSLIMFPGALRMIFPAVAAESEGLFDEMMRYALGGLYALRDANSSGPA